MKLEGWVVLALLEQEQCLYGFGGATITSTLPGW
jgi:hypothetical protein